MDGADHPGAHFGGPARVACLDYRGRETEREGERGRQAGSHSLCSSSSSPNTGGQGGGISPGSCEGEQLQRPGVVVGDGHGCGVEWCGGAQVVLGLCQVA
uniref:Uncharacterized protein n=1 Tax=Oryza punctata TaxID=4537 RepID=A0A0E0KIV5_ORYPU